jgi:hypothetical protein
MQLQDILRSKGGNQVCCEGTKSQGGHCQYKDLHRESLVQVSRAKTANAEMDRSQTRTTSVTKRKICERLRFNVLGTD